LETFDDPYLNRLAAKAKYHRERAEYWRKHESRRFDSAPGSFVTGSAGRRRSGLAKRSEKAINGSFEDARKAQWHEQRAAHYEGMIAYRLNTPARQAVAQRAKAHDKTSRAALRKAPVEDRLLIGTLSGHNHFYCDMSRERHNDYVVLAHLWLHTLELVIEPDCPDEFKPLIEADAAAIIARRGEQYEITASGQTITLGYASKGNNPHDKSN
jgi:hypothetical protein